MIQNPGIVTVDAGGSHHLSRPGAVPGKWSQLYLEVVVRYASDAGDVVTVFFNAMPPRGELLWLQKIADLIRRAQADPAWPERIRATFVDMQYDRSADVLYVAYGEATEAFSVPIGNHEEGLYLRVASDTDRIVGVEVLDFRRSFLARHADARSAFEPVLGLFGDMDWRVQIGPIEDDGTRELVLYTPAARASADYFPEYLKKAAPELLSAA